METVCLRSVGNWAETVSLYKGKQSNSYSLPVTVQRQTNRVVPILKAGGKGQDLFHITLKDPDLQVIVLMQHLSQRHRHKGVLCLWVYRRDYCKVIAEPGLSDPDGSTSFAVCFPVCNTPSFSLSHCNRVKSYQHGHSRLVLQVSHQSDIHQLSNLIVTQYPLQVHVEAACSQSVSKGCRLNWYPGPAFYQLLTDERYLWHSQGLAALHARVKRKL